MPANPNHLLRETAAAVLLTGAAAIAGGVAGGGLPFFRSQGVDPLGGRRVRHAERAEARDQVGRDTAATMKQRALVGAGIGGGGAALLLGVAVLRNARRGAQERTAGGSS